jgi:hypothetical protein
MARIGGVFNKNFNSMNYSRNTLRVLQLQGSAWFVYIKNIQRRSGVVRYLPFKHHPLTGGKTYSLHFHNQL